MSLPPSADPHLRGGARAALVLERLERTGLARGRALPPRPRRRLRPRPRRSSSARTSSASSSGSAIGVGCLGLAMLNHLTGGPLGPRAAPLPRGRGAHAPRRWRSLFVPVVLGASSLYTWAQPEVVAADELLQKKAAYLNVPFFAARAVFYFAVWGLLAWRLSSWSRQQDARARPGARGAAARACRRSGLVLLSLTTTFAAVDWGMSLAPHWFSTIYGVLFIVGWTLSALSFTIVLMSRLAGEAPFTRALQPVTVHDLGKLLLAFTMLWGYVNFSQFLIIWSGNVSEETPFYLRRLQGGWQVVAVALLVFHFALPFALLLSRDAQAQRADAGRGRRR